jgi:hypothetical protein
MVELQETHEFPLEKKEWSVLSGNDENIPLLPWLISLMILIFFSRQLYGTFANPSFIADITNQ